MINELQNTWNDIATHWNEWKAPLRPSPEDTNIIANFLASYYSHRVFNIPAKIFILGVTPELVNMNYPFPTYIEGMDKAEAMVQYVWPGNADGYRNAVVGDWLTDIKPNFSQDAVLADGSFVFFKPSLQFDLAQVVCSTIKPTGVLIARFFIQPSTPDSLSQIEKDLSDGYVTNFHSFKFRVAMALQRSFSEGVAQKDVYDKVQSLITQYNVTSFSEEDLHTLSFYKDKKEKHHFPTEAQLTSLLAKSFHNVQIQYPTYEFGDRCPIVMCSGRKF